MQIAGGERMKKAVVERVYEEIRKHGSEGAKAKDIAKATGFCMATVYKAVKELLMESKVKENIDGRTSIFIALSNAPQNLQNTQNMQNSCNIIQPQQAITPQPQHIGGGLKFNGGVNEIAYDMEDYKVEKDEDYVHRKFDGILDFELLDKAKRHRLNVLLSGPKGSGKTYMIKNWCAERNYPYGRVNMDGAITTEDFIGSWVRVGNEWVWSDGILTRFMKCGGVLVIDEINASPPEMLFILHSVLDDGKQIVLRSKDGEIVKAHDNFMLIACMNPNYVGTSELNEALEDRFDIVLYVDYDEEMEKKLIKNEKLIDFARRIRFMYNERKLHKTISTRALIQFEKNMELYGYEMAKHILLNKFDSEDRQAVGEALDMVLNKRNEEEAIEEENNIEGGDINGRYKKNKR